MSTWKPAKEAPAKPPVSATQPTAEDDTLPRAADVEVKSLEIDVDAELDCDPYNRTGQFLAEKIRKYEE